MTKKQKIMLARILISAAIFFPLFIGEHMGKLEGPCGISDGISDFYRSLSDYRLGYRI